MRATVARAERGFTLMEVLVALLIVAMAVSLMQSMASDGIDLAIETNHKRVAKMLLHQKAEEVIVDYETSTSGSFDGYPGYEWLVSTTDVPVGEEGEASIRLVTVSVRYPSLYGSDETELELTLDDEGNTTVGDGPGILRVTTYLDPLEEEAQ